METVDTQPILGKYILTKSFKTSVCLETGYNGGDMPSCIKNRLTKYSSGDVVNVTSNYYADGLGVWMMTTVNGNIPNAYLKKISDTQSETKVTTEISNGYGETILVPATFSKSFSPSFFINSNLKIILPLIIIVFILIIFFIFKKRSKNS